MAISNPNPTPADGPYQSWNPSTEPYQPGDAQGTRLYTPYGVYKPDKLNKLIQRVPRMSSLSWMMALGNMNKRTAHNFQYSFFEEGQHAPMSIGGATVTGLAPAASYPADVDTSEADNEITLAAADYYVIPTNVIYIAADESYHYVIGVSTNRQAFAVKSAQAVAAVGPAAAVAYTNAQPEDSDAPDSRSPQFEEVSNRIQTIRETFRVTDHEEKTELWFNVETPNGTMPYAYVKGIEDAAERLELQCELAFLIGKEFDSDDFTPTGPNAGAGNGTGKASSVLYAGKDVWTTQGLIPTIKANGQVDTAGIDGSTRTFVDAFTDMIVAIDDVYGPRDYMVGTGLDYQLALDKSVVESAMFGANNPQGGIGAAFDFSPVGGQDQAVSLNLKWINISGRQFFFQNWQILSHKASLGVFDEFRKAAYFIPMGKTRNPRQLYGAKNFEDYCQIVYIPPSGAANEVRGHFKIWETGANARSGATDAKLRREIHHATYKGFEIRNREKFATHSVA